MEIFFKRNWCEYLTECPYRKFIMVGSHECVEECKYCSSSYENARPQIDNTNYERYFTTWTGVVNCTHRK